MVSPNYTWGGNYKVDSFPQACKDATASCFLLTFCSATCVHLKDRRKAIRALEQDQSITQGPFVYGVWRRSPKSAVLEPLRNWAKISAMQPVKQSFCQLRGVLSSLSSLSLQTSLATIRLLQVTNLGGQTTAKCWFLLCRANMKNKYRHYSRWLAPTKLTLPQDNNKVHKTNRSYSRNRNSF